MYNLDNKKHIYNWNPATSLALRTFWYFNLSNKWKPLMLAEHETVTTHLPLLSNGEGGTDFVTKVRLNVECDLVC